VGNFLGAKCIHQHNTNKILDIVWKKLRVRSEKIEFLNKILSIVKNI